MNGHPLRLGGMVRAGGRDLSEYTGMVLALFLVQVIVTAGVWIVIARVLISAFAGRPVFDDAVDGDLVAWLEVVRDHREVFQAIGWIVVGAAIAWATISWFLVGGVLAVLTERPRGRRETARCTGALGQTRRHGAGCAMASPPARWALCRRARLPRVGNPIASTHLASGASRVSRRPLRGRGRPASGPATAEVGAWN